MDDTSAVIVAEARRWIGTPYRHRASVLGVGCDCLGLIVGLRKALGAGDGPDVPPYPPDWFLRDPTEGLWQGLQSALRPAEATLSPGDVLLFRLRPSAAARHLGVLSATGSAPRFIHAYSAHGVVESPLSAPWARRIVARFALI